MIHHTQKLKLIQRKDRGKGKTNKIKKAEAKSKPKYKKKAGSEPDSDEEESGKEPVAEVEASVAKMHMANFLPVLTTNFSNSAKSMNIPTNLLTLDSRYRLFSQPLSALSF